jgi:hypothetical protein
MRVLRRGVRGVATVREEVGVSANQSGTAPGTSSGPTTGNRRIDRVLAEDFLAELTTAPLEQIRSMRSEAEQEEVDLSYIRRMVQGRIDIIRAEVERRGGAASTPLVDQLASILADDQRAPARGLGRHTTLEPSRASEHRRYVERLVADVDLSDVPARSADQLENALAILAEEERKLSAKRREVQKVMDACSAEITRRYREGEADVSQLLAPQRGDFDS